MTSRLDCSKIRFRYDIFQVPINTFHLKNCLHSVPFVALYQCSHDTSKNVFYEKKNNNKTNWNLRQDRVSTKMSQ